MKRFLIGLLSIFCLFAVACSNPNESPSSSNSGNVTVTTPSGSLNYESREIARFESFQLRLSGVEGEASWESSNASVVTVDENGLIFGVKKGKATITATVGNETYTCEVSVSDSGKIPTADIDLVFEAVELTVGASYTLTPYVRYETSVYDDGAFTYEIANASVATVDTDGKITAVAAGETAIEIKGVWRGVEIVSTTVKVIVNA